MNDPLARFGWLLRCVDCADRPPLARMDGRDSSLLRCHRGHEYPVSRGVARVLRAGIRDALASSSAADAVSEAKRRTAASFGYEWSHFSELRPQWERNFRQYMAPHDADYFRGKLVLDAGSGAGRHAYYSAKSGADVVAVDLGDAIDVTEDNTRDLGNVFPVQADLYDLPFADGTFDFVYSIGVLHHVPDPDLALRELARVVRPGGEVHVYVYWRHGRSVRGALLALVTAARGLTTRLPYAVMRLLAYPVAALGYVAFVLPARLLWRSSLTRQLTRSFPLAGYAEYPFLVLVNDQFDRFTAPIERRFTAGEVRDWLTREGLTVTHLSANYGWVAGGERPAEAPPSSDG